MRDTFEKRSIFKVAENFDEPVIWAVAYACGVKVLPLSFCHTKPAFYDFCRSLVEFGKAHPNSTVLDVHNLLLSLIVFCCKVRRILRKKGARFQQREVPQILRCGGRVCCKGLKIEDSGAMFYGFIVHFIDALSISEPLGSSPWSISTQTLFIERYSVSETVSCEASSLRSWQSATVVSERQ